MRLTKQIIFVAVTWVAWAGVANAAPVDVDVYLQTQRFEKTLADGGVVPMWGFASCNSDFTYCTAPTEMDAPGPRIDAFAGRSLNIHVQNTLGIPVSISIPGQTGEVGRAPVMMASAPHRVQSFTHETAAGSVGAPSTVTTYTWNSLSSGTYLYQSGTFPSIEVPMGLYGALTVSEGPGVAYGRSFDAEAVLLLSEIDPIQNSRVAAAAGILPGTDCVPLPDYTQNMTPGYPCTVDYDPTYFLVNGAATADLPAGDPSQNLLLRFLNAGLRSHTPSIVGVELGLIAEDGKPYPGLQRNQSAALLAAGKTLDAIAAMPNTDHSYSLFDRMPTFSNENLPNGGSLATLQVGTGTPVVPPVASPANDDGPYAVTEDTPLNVGTSGGVLANDPGLSDSVIVSAPANGAIALHSDGSFTYTPNADYSGSDSFSYSASDGTDSYGAHVHLNVSFVNDTPSAAADAYANNLGSVITVAAPGVLSNDADADGDSLIAVLDSGTVSLHPDGSFTAGASGSFTYSACDRPLVAGACPAGSASASVSVDLTVNNASGLVLDVQEPGATGVAVTDYRWTVEEDAMWQPDPAAPAAESLATNFHRSYMPVVAQGCVGATACSAGETETPFAELALDPARHYYVSVLPADAMAEDSTGYRVGHTIGGAPIPPAAKRQSNTITVHVNKEPLPYAQISIFVFEDNSPTNSAVDGGERGLGGFQITLEDAGGRYGMSAGTMGQDADGNRLTNALDCFGGAPPAPGVILSCPDTAANRAAGLVGRVLIKNLFAGKYGVIASSPLGTQTQWVQTSTLEGTNVTDAWVKPNEPPFFTEFGPVGVHVFVGFVSPQRVADYVTQEGLVGTNTITGAITNFHMARPPNQTIFDSGTYDALSHTRPWIGLNSNAGIGANIAAVQATMNDDGTATFSIPNVPDGDYQIVVWDTYLDQVIAYRSVTQLDLDAGGNIGNVPVFNWYARLEHNVFLDDNEDGVRDAGEGPVTEQAINLRWRDGSMYQSFPTDLDGFVPFDQVFPFFNWLVAEVDYTRFKATGLTVTVDGGGDVSTTGHVLNPQIQADGTTSRTEVGPVLTQGFQGFLGQTSVFDWGKKPYAVGENGGIAGIVYYGVTRAEGDPRLAVAEPWEPGIARAKVRLYREVNRAASGIAGADTGLALVQETVTDSWDDSLPTGCPGADASDPVTPIDKCYDGLRNFNQARPAVFDGGYAFRDIPPGKYVVEVEPPPGYKLMKEEDVNVSFGDGYAAVFVMMPGGAVVPAVPDAAMVAAAKAAEPGLAKPRCVGELREVPRTLSLFPSANAEAPFALATRPLCNRKEVILSDQSQAVADFTLFTDAPIAGHFAGMVLDDVAQEFNPLSPQFGEKWAPPFVPISIRDYKGQEISRLYSDQWGQMNGLLPSTFSASMPSPSGFSPSVLMTCMNDPGPIAGPGGSSIIDPQYNPAYSNFCYTFQYMPGTTTYLDTPVLPVSAFASGYNPPDCSLDERTPRVLRVGWEDGRAGPWNQTTRADAAATTRKLDIYSTGIEQVPNPAYEGPLATGLAGEKTIARDFGFGSTVGTVSVGGVDLLVDTWGDDKVRVIIDSEDPVTGELSVTRGDNGYSTVDGITITVSDETPLQVPGEYPTIQAAIDAATPGALILVAPGVYNESPIMWKPVRLQGAGAGSTIINAVKRPTERLVAWRAKMDCLFGIGAGCTRQVDALPNQPDGAIGFDVSEGAGITVLGVFDDGTGTTPANSFLRGSVMGVFSMNAPEISATRIKARRVGRSRYLYDFTYRVGFSNSGAAAYGVTATVSTTARGISVIEGDLSFGSIAAGATGSSGSDTITLRWDRRYRFDASKINFELANDTAARIDGFSITGGDVGGGILVNSNADRLEIANNNVFGNHGSYHGGVRVGQPFLELAGNGPYAFNTNVSIHNNAITHNGGLGGAGGGVAITTGSDNYNVSNNFVCGNFTTGDGGGIGHLGLSDGGVIANNRIILNQSFNQAITVSGGGLFIGGEPPVAAGLSAGSGSVDVDANHFQANHAGAGHGGGIRTQFVNGQDVVNSNEASGAAHPELWNRIRIRDNVLINNVAGWSGGAVSLQDTASSEISGNTIAHNDSTATVGGLIVNNLSANQPAGISTEPHSGALGAAIPVAGNTVGLREFSNPTMTGNRLWENRSFHYDASSGSSLLIPTLTQSGVGECVTGATFWDLDTRLGGALTSATTPNPGFANPYCNGGRSLVTAPGAIFPLPALDEGGNAWIDVRFGPLTSAWPAGSAGWSYE